MSNEELLDRIVGGDEEEAEATTVEQDIDTEEVSEEEESHEETKQGSEEADETETKAEVEEKEEKKPSQTVPAGLFAEQRRQLRQSNQKIEELQSQLESLQGLGSQIEELRAQTQKNADPEPNPETHPAEYIAWKQRQSDNELNALKEQLKGFKESTEKQQETLQQQQQKANQQRELLRYIAQYEANVVKETPDYYDALKHLRQPYIDQYVAQGYSEQEALQAIGQQEFNQAVQLIAQGQDPSKYFYYLAQQSGYKPASESEAPNELDEKIDSIEKGKKSSKTLGQSGNIDIDEVLEMDDDSFAVFKEARKELFG